MRTARGVGSRRRWGLAAALLLWGALASVGCVFDGNGFGDVDGLVGLDPTGDAPARDGVGDHTVDATDARADIPRPRDGGDAARDGARDGEAEGLPPELGPDLEPDVGHDGPAQPSCSDGQLNGAETDIDCGGPTCSACIVGKACKKTTDCASPNVCSALVCAQPNSCAVLHTERPGLPTANYAIKPSTDPAINTRCDMTADGGGWTLIMRTVWDWTDSQKLMTGFAAVYNTTAGAATGAFRLPAKHWVALGAQKKLLLSAAPRTKAGTACGPLRYVTTGTALSASLTEVRFDGFAALLLWPQLSATDLGPNQACSTTYGGVPWFYKQCCLICPTLSGAYWSPARPSIVLSQLQKVDQQGKTITDVCTAATEASNGYVGIDTMEWYLR